MLAMFKVDSAGSNWQEGEKIILILGLVFISKYEKQIRIMKKAIEEIWFVSLCDWYVGNTNKSTRLIIMA